MFSTYSYKESSKMRREKKSLVTVPLTEDMYSYFLNVFCIWDEVNELNFCLSLKRESGG